MKRGLLKLAQIASEFEASGNLEAGKIVTDAMHKVAMDENEDHNWTVREIAETDWEALSDEALQKIRDIIRQEMEGGAAFGSEVEPPYQMGVDEMLGGRL